MGVPAPAQLSWHRLKRLWQRDQIGKLLLIGDASFYDPAIIPLELLDLGTSRTGLDYPGSELSASE